MKRLSPDELAKKHDLPQEIFAALRVVSNPDHPHFGCTGYLTDNVIKVGGKMMVEMSADNCKHMCSGFFVTPQDVRPVAPAGRAALKGE